MPLNHLTGENETTPGVTPVAAAIEEGSVAAYLDALEAELGRELPASLRRELREELRQHLEAQVAACMELGDSQEQALEAALSRFGESAPLARRFRRAYAQREFRAHPVLFLGAPLLWGAGLLTAGLVSGREIAMAETEALGLLLTLAFPLLYCLTYSRFPSPKRQKKPILVDLIFPILWYGGNFLLGGIQGGLSGAVELVHQTPMPAALWCFSLGWLVAPSVLIATGAARRKRLAVR